MRAGSPLALAVIAVLAAGCARLAPAPVAVPEAAPPGFPAADYVRAAAAGEPVLRVDPARSLAVVHVDRAGPLARFGHEHVVASHDLHGYVRLAHAGGRVRADLYAPLAALAVDEPRLRAEAGLDTRPAPSDIEGTRRNMLDKVLEAQDYPYVVVRLRPRAVGGESATLEAEVSLHGRTRTLPVAVRLERPDARTLRARGRFALAQSDFGIAPYSALGGALRVADRLEVAFTVYAAPLPAP